MCDYGHSSGFSPGYRHAKTRATMSDCSHNVEHKKVLCFICQKELYDGCIYCHYEKMDIESWERCGRFPFAYDFYCEDCRCYIYPVKKEEKGNKIQPVAAGKKLQWKDLTDKKYEEELRQAFPKTKILYGIKLEKTLGVAIVVHKESNEMAIMGFDIRDGLEYNNTVIGTVPEVDLDAIIKFLTDLEKNFDIDKDGIMDVINQYIERNK